MQAAVRRQCPFWLAGQADDIVQNAVLRLLGKWNRGDGIATFSSVYLEKSVSGAVVDEIRRLARRRERPLENRETLDAPDARQADPEQETSSREIARGILHCLHALAVPRRMAVALYLQGCTVPETAERLGWSLRKTESLVYRGLANLRDCLTARGLTP